MRQLGHTIIGIGELLWDIFPTGKQLGGAPANFTYHAQQLGAKGYLVSVVGNDKEGDEILSLLIEKGLSVDFIRQKDYVPTGSVTVQFEGKGVPVYSIHENVAWDYIPEDTSLYNLLETADVFCFGTLAQRNSYSFRTIQSLLNKLPATCKIVFDVNLRQHYYTKTLIETSLKYANVLKLNEDELQIISGLFNLNGDDLVKLEWLFKTYKLQLIALTKGAKGSFLYTSEEKSWLDTPEVEVIDTVGAGDAFTAAMIISLLKGLSIDEVHRNAVRVAGFVASQSGGMPVLNEKVLNHFISNN